LATNFKVLGQSAPSATTATTLYTVPNVTEAVVSTITIANRSSSTASYRLAVRPNGATLANQHYIAYDVAISANDTTALTLGIALAQGDVITVYASSANLSFNAWGTELT
jgi:hypothetical protein